MPLMPNRSTKGKVVRLRKARMRDVNQMARAVVEHVERIADEEPGKNPAAVALGPRGGLKGGRPRRASLPPDRRHGDLAPTNHHDHHDATASAAIRAGISMPPMSATTDLHL